jgi:hypothetical protein
LWYRDCPTYGAEDLKVFLATAESGLCVNGLGYNKPAFDPMVCFFLAMIKLNNNKWEGYNGA